MLNTVPLKAEDPKWKTTMCPKEVQTLVLEAIHMPRKSNEVNTTLHKS